MTFTATIPGDPRGKGSVRIFGGRATKDPKTAAYMATCIYALRAEWRGRAPIEEPTRVAIDAYLARPAKLVPNPRARKQQPPVEAFPAPCKPDSDNIAKSILDSLTQAGVIIDDCRVVELVVRKWYCAIGQASCAVVEVGW